MSDTSAADNGGFDPGRLRTAPMQMLRSRDDRYIAGVCGGLARYLNIDPVVVRVLLAALTVVGGVGLVLYAAAWLLAPEEGAERSVLEAHLPASPRVRMLGWIVAGVVAVGAVVGSGPWFGWGWIGPLPLLGLAVLVWVLARPRNSPPDQASPNVPMATPPTASPAATSPAATSPASAPPPTASPVTETSESPDRADSGSGTGIGDRPADEEPTAPVATTPHRPTPPPPPPAPRRPRYDGTLTWLTLGALAALIGLLWLFDQSGSDVDGPVYLASSLAVVAGGMLAGTWWGNGRWLIPVGAALTITLITVSQLPVWKFGKIDEAPTRADDVLSSYEMGAGQIRLDLTKVEDLAALDGRTIRIDNGLGQTEVLVPDDLDVTIVAELNGGDIEIFDREANGADASTQYTDADDVDPDVRIEIDGSFGDVKVIRP